jgi:hypothetical protein
MDRSREALLGLLPALWQRQLCMALIVAAVLQLRSRIAENQLQYVNWLGQHEIRWVTERNEWPWFECRPR